MTSQPTAPARSAAPGNAAPWTSILADRHDFRTAQEIHDELRRRGDSVGLTTVYRTLQAMTDAGELDALRNADGETAYRRCSTGITTTWSAAAAAVRSRSPGRRWRSGPMRGRRARFPRRQSRPGDLRHLRRLLSGALLSSLLSQKTADNCRNPYAKTAVRRQFSERGAG